jgi:2-polyprenyl-3-methyl-5-hydroxy-6-metoxy-1,4-benzoquinol methylase
MKSDEAPAARTDNDIWNSVGEKLSKGEMALRIKAVVSQRGWKEVVRMLAGRGIPMNKLAVAEVGCGTGTTALTFGLMGAAVTLIDNNENVLERTRRIYGQYGCTASFVKTDCLAEPLGALEGSFDLVLSSGLAEHFSGEDRGRCIAYHKRLTKTGGIVSISVPNARSPSYWLVRSMRVMTGTWLIDFELPFSHSELSKLAAKAGFTDSHIVGYVAMRQDLSDCITGLGYAAVDALPKKIADVVRKWKSGRNPHLRQESESGEDMQEYCRKMACAVTRNSVLSGPGPNDVYCSHLVLIAFK